MGHGGFVEEQDGLDACQVTIDVGQRTFVLEIDYGTHTAQDVRAAQFVGNVGGQGGVGNHRNTGFLFVEVAYHPDAFLYGEHTCVALQSVVAHSDDNLVAEVKRTPDDAFVSFGEGVKGTGEYQLHVLLFFVLKGGILRADQASSSSMTRLLMMNSWRSIVFLPM